MDSKRFQNILFVVALLIFVSYSLGLVSAFDFDNTYSYNETTKTATIENMWNLPFLGSDLAVVTLTSPFNVEVGAGLDVLVGEFNFSSYGNVTDVFGNLFLKNMKNNNSISRGKQYKYKKYTNISVDDFSIPVCENITTENNSIIEQCVSEEIGSHFEIQMDWVPISNPNIVFLSNVTYEIGVFVDVKVDDYCDWKPEILGVEIPEWATWDSSLNNSLVAFWEFETNGAYIENLISSSSNYSLENVGGDVQNSSDFLGNGLRVENSGGAAGQYLKSVDSLPSTTDESLCAWVKPHSVGDAYTLFSTGDASSGSGDSFSLTSGTNGGTDYWAIWRTSPDYESSSLSSTDVDSWTHLCMTKGTGVGIELFLNGVSILNHTDVWSTNSTKIVFGCSSWLTNCGDYTFTQAAYWDRALVGSEIGVLYAGGEGMTYSSCTENLLNTTWTSWEDNSSCFVNDTKIQVRSLLQYDNNSCGETVNQTFYEYQELACNYCSYNAVNTSWSSWEDTEVCQTNDYLTQNKSLVQYDSNYDSCYAVTGLASDELVNQTFWDYQELVCNYCSYNIVNSSWSSWNNQTSCFVNDTLIQNKSLIEYDENYSTCYVVTSIGADLWNSGNNNTFWDFQEGSCDYCTPNLINTTWSSWANDTICNISGFQNQSRSLVQYDNNFCGEVSNTTFYDYQVANCTYIPCINAPVNTSWSFWADAGACLQSNTIQQSRYIVTYDLNNTYCGNFTNITYYDSRESECSYVGVSDDTFTWGVDFTKDINRWLLFGSFAVAIALFFFKQYKLSSIILFLNFATMFFSGVNWIFVMIVLVASVLVAGRSKA